MSIYATLFTAFGLFWFFVALHMVVRRPETGLGPTLKLLIICLLVAMHIATVVAEVTP